MDTTCSVVMVHKVKQRQGQLVHLCTSHIFAINTSVSEQPKCNNNVYVVCIRHIANQLHTVRLAWPPVTRFSNSPFTSLWEIYIYWKISSSYVLHTIIFDAYLKRSTLKPAKQDFSQAWSTKYCITLLFWQNLAF